MHLFIIPKIRTKVCNKDVKNIIQEARNLIAAGHHEIVLTGIFLGAYGQITARRKRWGDPAYRDSLADMVSQVAALPGLARLRLSSLEPADVTDRLLEVFGRYPTLMPHLHLPLQSGSGRILRRMARQYSIDRFVDVIDRIKDAIDRPAITTDIIIGFPGETVEVIVENIPPPRGRCERYFMVDLSSLPNAAELKKGQLVSLPLSG